jgi:carboxypeptidase family protein
MRSVLTVVLASLVATTVGLAGQAPAVTASFTGTVTTGDGPEARPVRHAHVTLKHEPDQAVRSGETDVRGMYRFDHLTSGGEYRVSVDKPGFVASGWQVVPDGAASLDVMLRRGGAIEGRVTTDAGNPLQNVSLVAIQPTDGSALGPTSAESKTDDLGRFRIFGLAAGEYYVRATYGGPAAMRLVPGDLRPGPQQIFYPAASTVDAAKTVTVTEGRDVGAVELTMPPGPKVPDPNFQIDLGDGHDYDRWTGRIPTAEIAGRVLAGDTHKPIRDAVIRLLSIVSSGGSGSGTFGRTDAQGRFDIRRLPAGRYRLSASADRYLEMNFGETQPGAGARPIDVRAGDVFANADFALPRAGAIEGTLLDELGDPAPGVSIVATRLQFVAGRRRLIPLESNGQRKTTDDRGHYRLVAVPPGDYRVIAQAGVFSDGNDFGGYAPTYFAGTDDSRAAAAVHVPLGGDAPEASFSLTAARTVTVSGSVRNAEEQAVSAMLLLTVSDSLGRPDFAMGRGSAGPDGRFALRNVPPGTYVLQAYLAPGEGGNPSGRPFGSTRVSVGDADIDGVVVRTSRGHALRGRIVMNDATAPSPKPGDLLVFPAPVDFDSSPIIGFGPPPQDVHDDLSFEVRNLFGVRRVLIIPRAEGFALDRIVLDGRDVTETALDFRESDVDSLQIVLTPRVTHVTGSIRDAAGKPLLDYGVVVFSADSSHWGDRSRFVALGRPNQQGVFDVKGLPPDDYLAVALADVSSTEYYDPDFLETLRPFASSFTLGDGESKTLNLTLKRRLGSW